ncbi:polygalacturonase inhibitor-like [Eucalyptus grandis]|uniref:polygalacturonase inhibitor-like n=1 Tax=Eucalyptus grandis TaxID=71139 RepID=UPI00192EA96A|nr:polygalacturonase inhibitor-like [Eucalyptus grandis]
MVSSNMLSRKFCEDPSWNRLQGYTSLLFGVNKTNDYIDISRNLFEFNLSRVELSQSIMWLDINPNKIDGAMPEAMKDLLLQFSDLSYNRLCGEIPVGERS